MTCQIVYSVHVFTIGIVNAQYKQCSGQTMTRKSPKKKSGKKSRHPEVTRINRTLKMGANPREVFNDR